MAKDKETVKKILMDNLEKIGEELNLEVGKPLSGSEFIDLMQQMKKTYDEKGWDATQKTFHDFYQQKNRKDKDYRKKLP